MKGQRLLREGKYEQAIESLQVATRLMPKYAQAHNHLGLALQGNRQFAPALASYQRALALDHKLPAPHYNLGCLYLEQNEPVLAIDQLTTYTLLQPNSPDGWLKLGEAQLRAHKLDAAEKSFKAALDRQARHPEALNGMGIIQLQRRRPQDALNYFNSALGHSPNYGPALLNVAIVNQQLLNNRQAALETYRRYLALQPRPANWEAVSVLAGRLDLELNPPPVHLAQVSPLPPPPVVKTNLIAVQTNPPVRVFSNRPTPLVAAVTPPLRTNGPTSSPALSRVPPQTNQGNTNPLLAAHIKAPVIEAPKPPPPAITNKPPEVEPPKIEVTRVADELVIKPPQEISVVRPPLAPAPTLAEKTPPPATNPAPPLEKKDEPKPEKRSFISRLNPFGGKPKSATKEKVPLSQPETIPTNQVLVSASGADQVVATPPVLPPPPLMPRYTYISPSRPGAGNHREAERFFAEGIKAQQSKRFSQALAAYQKAIQLDPAYFEAYYNRGLAAYGLGDWKESLSDYEYALSLKPTSVDARYNFALALQQANYPRDAADELLEILNENPAETRAHLLLANLFARQLNQPKLARQYYLKVLENEPHHPNAAGIRYWLAANP